MPISPMMSSNNIDPSNLCMNTKICIMVHDFPLKSNIRELKRGKVAILGQQIEFK